MKKAASNVSKKPANAEERMQSGGSLRREGSAMIKSEELMKRFTIDVPVDLHTRIKTECARRGRNMAAVLRQLLEREFPKE